MNASPDRAPRLTAADQADDVTAERQRHVELALLAEAQEFVDAGDATWVEPTEAIA